MPETPTDHRAVLLTDLVDSTALGHRLGDAAMAAAWAAHDRAARDLLPLWRGREIDKSDGLLLLFDGATDAVGYALAYHQALAALPVPLQARAGLHVGPVTLRENSAADIARGAKPLEVDGLAKAIAARVMSVALGGQTLLSAQALLSLDRSGLQLMSHGWWRLKGLDEPVRLFEVGTRDTAFTPPPDASKAHRVVRQGGQWLPAGQLRHHLPAERDAFVGRQDALLDLARRIDGGARLITILGLGGTGKTRLAIRFGWSWLGEFPGGVWFCDLSQARDVDALVHAVAAALGLPPDPGDALARIGRAIAQCGRCLVILDNFEQLTRDAEATLGHWLDAAAEASFVVTSREVLGLPGEHTLALPPLPQAHAEAMFRCRAEAVRHDFAPTAEDNASIAPLVRLLEGLPLAIELAAARVRVMPPRVLLERMRERFKLLASTGGRNDRQATLRAAFDWSWELLSPIERSALAQLSVFEGGFSLQAAEAVLEFGATSPAPWPADAVQQLVEKSFVRRIADDRFDLLASVQEYLAEHLRSPGHYPGSGAGAALAAQQRHGAYFALLDEAQATAGACVELNNLAAACRRAVARGDAAQAARVLQGAWAALKLRGPLRVGIELAGLVLDMAALGPVERARVQRVAGDAMQSNGLTREAREYLEAALTLAQEADDRDGECRARCHLGRLLAEQGQMVPAQDQNLAALHLARELGDRDIECEVLGGLGKVSIFLGNMAEARSRFDAAVALARATGNRRLEGGMLGNLGIVAATQGRSAEAQAHFEASLAVARELGDRPWEGNALCNLGLFNHEQGRIDAARTLLDAALGVARSVGLRRLECVVLCNLGLIADSQQQPAQALARYEAAVALARELADRRSEGQFLGYLGLLHARQGRFDLARRCLGAGLALLREMSDLNSLALLLCGQAEAECLADGPAAAHRALLEARELVVQLDDGPGLELTQALQRVAGLIEAGAREPGRPQLSV